MKVVFLLAFVFVLSVRTALPSGEEQQIIFNNWKIKYNKNYETTEEYNRLENFKNSITRIESRNAKSKNSVFGLNKFSDLSTSEFKKKFLGYLPSNSTAKKSVFPRQKIDVPDTFDWRDQNKVTPVKDQQNCGSCWAFSVTENIESVYMISKGLNSMDALSPQQIVDCDTTDSGCKGGDPPTAYAYVISAGGLETDSDYPYTASDGDCSFDSNEVDVSISNWKYATKSQDESEMQSNLISWGPLSICVDAQAWQDYSGGVLSSNDCGTTLDHCVQVVGYDTSSSSPFWSVRNSWGTDWGENGYIRLQFGQDTCGIADEATSACIDC